MKCSECGTDNLAGAKFCRYCGLELCGEDLKPLNVMDKFPRYNFIPTNLIDWKKPWFAKLRTILFSVILGILIVIFSYSVAALFSSYSYIERKYDSYDEKYYYRCHTKDRLLKLYSDWGSDENVDEAQREALDCYRNSVFIGIVIPGLISLMSAIIVVYGRRKYPSKDNHLNNYADYVQKYRYSGFIRGRKNPILKFYIKDNLMGLLDVAHYCVFLKAQYDKLEWREKNKYLNATIGNKSFIIDIYGKKLK